MSISPRIRQYVPRHTILSGEGPISRKRWPTRGVPRANDSRAKRHQFGQSAGDKPPESGEPPGRVRAGRLRRRYINFFPGPSVAGRRSAFCGRLSIARGGPEERGANGQSIGQRRASRINQSAGEERRGEPQLGGAAKAENEGATGCSQRAEPLRRAARALNCD